MLSFILRQVLGLTVGRNGKTDWVDGDAWVDGENWED